MAKNYGHACVCQNHRTTCISSSASQSTPTQLLCISYLSVEKLYRWNLYNSLKTVFGILFSDLTNNQKCMCQYIIWTNAGILLIGPIGTNFSEISIGIQTLSFKKMHLKMSSAKWRPSCLGLNVLMILQALVRLLYAKYIKYNTNNPTNTSMSCNAFIESSISRASAWMGRIITSNEWTSNGSWCQGIKG